LRSIRQRLAVVIFALRGGNRLGLITVAAIVWLAVTAVGVSQESEPVPAEPPKTESAPVIPRVTEPLAPVGPDTFILLDEQGRPQPILGMTYEEFTAAWKKLRELEGADREPTYIIKSLNAEGRLEAETAILEVRMEIELKSTGLTEVPLGFRGAILSNLDSLDPTIQLSYDESRGGYIAWARGGDKKTLHLSLPLELPLNRDGNRHALQLNVPRALVNKLVLDTPEKIVSPAVTEGAVVRLADRGNEGSRLTVTGLVGDVALSWQAPGTEATDLGTVLSATGQLVTSVDGRSARTEANLRVESFGGKFQQFRLRLPPGAQLVGQEAPEVNGNQPDYKLSPVTTTSQPTEERVGQRGQIWIVEFAEPTLGPVEVRLATEQAIGLSRADAPTELAGFEVLGAVRQFGELALRVDPNWQLRWNQVNGGRQINVEELDQDFPAEPALLGFQYYQQPWSLPVEVRPRDTRISVSPKYRLELTPEEARLKVTLQYQLAGAQEMRFLVKLAGWEVTADPIEPTRLIDGNNIKVFSASSLEEIGSPPPIDAENLETKRGGPKNDYNVLELPLTQAASRRLEITFQARRAMPAPGSKIDFPLPTPIADSIGTGELVVWADPSLLVTPSTAQTGLAARPLVGDAELPIEAGLVQVASYRSFLDQLLERLAFSAEVTPRSGELQATIESHVDVGSQLTQVEHTILFESKYRPVSQVTLSMPVQLAQDPTLRITLLPGNGAPGTAAEGTPIEVRPAVSDTTFGDELVDVAIPLPQPRLGRFRVRVDYVVPSDIARSAALASVAIPLPTPAQIPVTSQSATVSTRELPQLELAPNERESAWSVDSALDSTTSARTALKSDGLSDELFLTFRQVRRVGEGRTVVERVWLQSWYTPTAHQERFVFRLQSNSNSLTVELPPKIASQEVEVVLDGRPVLNFVRRAGQLIVPLSRSTELAPHTLEMRYVEARNSAPWSRVETELPQIGGEAVGTEFKWQVVMPRNYWVVRGPVSLAKAHDWEWTSAGLRPVPFASTSELESMSGAMSRRTPVAGEAEYLFSGFGTAPPLDVVVARSELLHLALALLVLGAGLGLLYVPVLRKPAVLFAGVVAILFAGSAYPEALLIGGPALAFGALLALMASLLYLLVPRRMLEETAAPLSTAYSVPPSSREGQLASPFGVASTNAPTITMRPSESKA